MTSQTDYRWNAPLVRTEQTPILSPERFKDAFRNHPAGVAVITADDGSGPVAMTASSVFSVSAVPPLIVFSASAMSSSTPTLQKSESVVIHMIGVDELWLAKLGATSGIDRFDDVAWSRLPSGEPYYTEAATWIRGRIVSRLDAGSATLFVVQALETNLSEGEAHGHSVRVPLVYHNRTWHKLDSASIVPSP